MDKWSKIFLISLSTIGFSFLGHSLTYAEDRDLEVTIEKIKNDIKKQEIVITSMQSRYNNILKQEEEVKNFLEWERKGIDQPQEEAFIKEEEVHQLTEEEIKKLYDFKEEAQKTKLAAAEAKKEEKLKKREEVKQKQTRRLELEEQKQVQAKLLAEEKEKERLFKVEEARRRKPAIAEGKKQKQPEEQRRLRSLSVHEQQQLIPERDMQMVSSMKGKEETSRNNSIEELDELIKRQQELFEGTKKLEIDFLGEETKLSSLEENYELSQKEQKGLRQK
jgi:colicin import membrane protein